MNIDVKNAYDNVIRQMNDSEIENFVKSIYDFISYISINNVEERYEIFCDIYVGKYIDNSFKSNICVNNEMVDFYTVLGKYYLFSGFDKKDIDRSRFVEYIKKGSEICRKNEVVNDTKRVKEINNEPYLKTIGKNELEIENKEEADIMQENEQSLDELLNELYSLIGLGSVKEEVNQMINLIKVQKKGEELGEKKLPLSLHMVFYGNPGTGKTTVARLLGKIYKALGVLSKGQLIEVDRGTLVGGYVGQTAIKTKEVIDRSIGGILFVDEAYTLTHGKGENDFGQESVDTILKAMEDYREDFIVIVAGYPDLMKEFIGSNPGLKSRFNQYINFEDYKSIELKKIFELQCKKQNLILGEGCDDFLDSYFKLMYDNRTKDYANGRDVRNYFEKMIKTRANRLNLILDGITKEEFCTIVVSDLEQAAVMKSADW